MGGHPGGQQRPPWGPGPGQPPGGHGYPPPPQSAQKPQKPPKKKKRGGCGCGCFFFLLILAAVVVLGYLQFWGVYDWMYTIFNVGAPPGISDGWVWD